MTWPQRPWFNISLFLTLEVFLFLCIFTFQFQNEPQDKEASKTKWKEEEKLPAPPEPESDDSTSGTEAETGHAGDVEEGNIRLSKSAVHEEYDQISETLQVKTKTGKRIKVKKWKSSCKQLPIMKTIRAKDNVFHDVLDRVRTIVKKYSHSINAMAEL